ncbi:MAG: histidine phosphatase family protein [Myxococcales bacterium]|nr:histidine phosphatase family protein [Myxococcales bacterium]
MTELFLVRHGEVHNPSRLRYGRLAGYALSEQGRRDVESCARWISSRGARVRAIVSSPLERAVETADILRAELSLQCEVRADPRLIEAESRFDGLRYRADFWGHAKRWLERGHADEAPALVASRMREALRSIADGTRDAAIVVSHQLPIQYLQVSLRGVATVRSWHRRPRCETASVTVLAADGATLRVREYWQRA